MKSWVKKYPVAAYVVMTVVWSWAIWSFLFLFIKPGGLVHNPPAITYLFVVLGGIGPSLSGLLLTKFIYGKEGMKAIWARFRNGRVGWWWLAVLIIPAVTLAMPIIRSFYGTPLDWSGFAKLIGPGIGLGITAGFMEEFGWRGFLLPHLLKKYSPLVATIFVGLIWGGLWHGYADIFGLGDKGLYSLPLILLLGPVLLTAWSLIQTWVYKGAKGSLLMSIFVHASISSSALIFGQKYGSNSEELLWTAVSVGLALVVSSAIWIGNRKMINSKSA